MKIIFFYLINIVNSFVFHRQIIIKKIKHNIDDDFTTEWDFYNQTYKNKN